MVCLFSEVKWSLLKHALKTSDSIAKKKKKELGEVDGEENSASVSPKPSVSI